MRLFKVLASEIRKKHGSWGCIACVSYACLICLFFVCIGYPNTFWWILGCIVIVGVVDFAREKWVSRVQAKERAQENARKKQLRRELKERQLREREKQVEQARLEAAKKARERQERERKLLERRKKYREKLEQVEPKLLAFLSKVERNLSERYPRRQVFEAIRWEAAEAVKKMGPLPPPKILPSQLFTCLERIHQIGSWDTPVLASLQQSYLKRVLSEYEVFFDSVESNPLTQEQRTACVVDEENNLVLAGAGSGKTSVLVARAGFLLSSKQAKPDDILLLAFANKAAAEIKDRISEKLKSELSWVSTFHSLGMKIIAASEGKKPSIARTSSDERFFNHKIATWLQELLLTDEEYFTNTVSYCAIHKHPCPNELDFENYGEYLQFIKQNELRTLQGELVKSFEECVIANHLFRLGVDYEYEATYEHETAGPDYRQYRPDFYLPRYDIYIEHVGIDRDGKTAHFVDQERYHAGLEWKRNLHTRHKTTLIETYSYQHTEGCLLPNLEKMLELEGVEFSPIDKEEMLNHLRETGEISELAKLLAQMVRQFRNSQFTPVILSQKINSHPLKKSLRQMANLFRPILRRYIKYLEDNREIDFEAMISKATDYVLDGTFIPKWKFILVDEFQDISQPRAKLLKAIKDRSRKCSLFCVGDDWQAIYRFTGSDLNFVREFENEFGLTQTTKLQTTFRFNNQISDVASKFVRANPNQIPKKLSTITLLDDPAVSLYQIPAYDNEARIHLAKIFSKIASDSSGRKSKVFVLCRFNSGLPRARGISLSNFQHQFTNLEIEELSIHSSKGKEADYVVILGMTIGGLPILKETHPMLELFLPESDGFSYSEERRVFYVAMTRAKKKVYLVTKENLHSPFIKELLKEDYSIDVSEFSARNFGLEVNCRACTSGILIKRTNQDGGTFWGCSHYPLCRHVEKGCDECGNVMVKRGDYMVCASRDCKSWRPVCKQCKGSLVKRQSSNGEFWGCENYRGDNAFSCTETKNFVPSPLNANR